MGLLLGLAIIAGAVVLILFAMMELDQWERQGTEWQDGEKGDGFPPE